MSTQTAFPVGTRLVRREKKNDELDELVVTGSGTEVIVQPASFGASFALTGPEIKAEYDYVVDADTILNAPTYLHPGPSPEDIFAEDAKLPKTVPVVPVIVPDENGDKTIEQIRAEAELAQKNEIKIIEQKTENPKPAGRKPRKSAPPKTD